MINCHQTFKKLASLERRKDKNMQAKIVGKSRMKGTSKKTGKPYDGTSVYVIFKDDRVEGESTSNKFVDTNIIKYDDVKVGWIYDFINETNFSGFTKLVGLREIKAG